MFPARVDQDVAALEVKGEAKMIAHRLVPVKARGEPERRRQIDPCLPLARIELRCYGHSHRRLLPLVLQISSVTELIIVFHGDPSRLRLRHHNPGSWL